MVVRTQKKYKTKSKRVVFFFFLKMIKETNTAKEKLEQKLQRREEGSHLDA